MATAKCNSKVTHSISLFNGQWRIQGGAAPPLAPQKGKLNLPVLLIPLSRFNIRLTFSYELGPLIGPLPCRRLDPPLSTVHGQKVRSRF